ncbi:acyl-CoA thioesterase [Rouxiella silvae]|uniref:Acyl-CoA thioesterase n=1 Tax=Rouxiella silvae TaxID=1646373 RepID=A0ABX3U0J5_9GAMM|nr:putative acyl-CoA thioester hydrolase [Rouxiella silvae]KQN47639.1 acyl-CoA thioesterase [Serratia sp. Leaf50]ORJ21046.1 acyl-CoA thioesterase [Rouxiella silvae]
MKISTLSRASAILSATLVLAACSHSQEGLSTQVAPGTAALPILNADEAANYTAKSYLAFGGPSVQVQQQGWTPVLAKTDGVNTPYVVGPKKGVDGAQYTHVQQAINAALSQHNHGEREFIKILPGTYVGAVYIPAGSAPISLFGAGNSADEVVLQQGLEASVAPAAYRKAVSSNGEFLPGDRAWYMFNQCASQQNESIGAGCSATVWSQGNGLQLQNLTVANSLEDSTDAGEHPAVALRVDGDQTLLENVHVLGRENTLLLNTSDINSKPVTSRYTRVYVHNSLIAGDSDYVTGMANAVFDHVEFHTLSSRGVKQASIFAPITPANVPYGYLVIDSNLTGDKGFNGQGAAQKAQLGRSVDLGADKGGYSAGQTPNGQLVIRDSQIDGSYNLQQPWGDAAFSERPFSGNIAPNRDLNDTGFNRLWQFNNVIAGLK